jgi:hypothetical protein
VRVELEPTPVEKLSGAPPYGMFLALLTNIRLGLPGINNNYAFSKKKLFA